MLASGAKQLQAMKDRGILIDFVDCDGLEVRFINGVVLPILAYWSPDRERELDEPVEGGWIEFGNDQVGYGWYPCKMITEEEFEEERRARARIAREKSAHEARPN